MDRNILCPRSLRYLLAVAEHRSFTRAAEALFVSQPTLSQQIKHLEEELGAQLLDRSGRSVRLTDAGVIFSDFAGRALRELEAGKRAIHDVQDLSRGSLRLGTTPITEHLASLLLDNFNLQHPGITISIQEMSQDQIESDLAADSIDLGIAFTSSMLNQNFSDELEVQFLFLQPLALVVGAQHPCAKRETPLSINELGNEKLALLNNNFALRGEINKYCTDYGIAPSIVLESNSLSVIIETVRYGRCATILPCSIACAQNGLFPVIMRPSLPHHTITLVMRKSAYRNRACSVFADMAKQWGRSNTGFAKKKLTPCSRAETCVLEYA